MIEETASSFQAAEIEAEHGTGSALLFAGNIVLRVRRKSRVIHFANFGVCVEMSSNGDSVGIVLEHTDGECLDAPGDQEAVHGSQARSGGALDEINFLGIFRTCENNATTGRVAVAIEIFRHGVNDDVRPERDRTLQVRT